MIANFSDFGRETIDIFLKNQCYKIIFTQYGSMLSQKRQCFADIYV
jgi:hypothetical protein